MSYHKKQSNGHNYTKSDIEKIQMAYKKANSDIKTERGWLEKLSKELGRSKANICRYAREMGWTKNNRKVISQRTLTKRVCRTCKKDFMFIKGAAKTLCSKECYQIWKADRWSFDKHPKGMLGKKQNKEHVETLRKLTIERWADKKSIYHDKEYKTKKAIKQSKAMIIRLKDKPSSIYSRTHKGWMEYENGKKYYMRSMWEMNYSCYLEFLAKHKQIKQWTYEEDTFWFEKIKRGVRSYTPDFKIINLDFTVEYHEVKGWMDKKSKTKIKRFNKYYPQFKLVIIDEQKYKNIAVNKNLYRGWQ